MKRKRYLWAHPSGRVYFRKNGQYTLIDAAQGTPEFDALYWEIMKGKPRSNIRTWKALIDELKNSEKWADYKPRYRQDLEPILTYLEEKIGSREVSRLSKSDIYRAMDRKADKVGFANYIPTAITILAKMAMRRNWRTDNPAEGIERLKVPEERKKPHVPWTDEAVAKWREKAEPLPLLIFEVGIGSVQRPGDWVDFKWADYDGESLSLNQNKTGKWLWLPCSEHLKSALDAELIKLSGNPDPERHIITKPNGSPMTYREMAKVMYQERVRLGVEVHDQHALRYRGVMELAAAGCTDDQIASFSGHSSKAMIIKYAGMARQKMRASEAAAKRSEQANKSTTNSETDTKGDTQ